MLPLFLGGYLALIPDSTPAQAQTANGGILLAQRTVVDSLPPPPNFQLTPYKQQRLKSPQRQPIRQVPWNSYNQNFQPYQRVRGNQYNQTNQNFQPYKSAQANSYSWNYERYLVYVEGNSYQQLERIRQIEGSAYIRNYNGRSVIQSGAFSKAANAQQRVRELELNGISGARIVKSTNGQEIGYSANTGGNSRQKKSDFYYVTVPAKSEALSSIASRIRQNSGRYDIVVERAKPLGPHVAVGPFTRRSDAEQWNDYIRKLGYGNARVYYGR